MLTKAEQNLLASIDVLLAAEEVSIKKIRESEEAKNLADTRVEMLGKYRVAIRSGNIDLMLALERKTVNGAKERYVNSEAMRRSLTAALLKIDVIQANVDLMRDPKRDYRASLITHALPSTRKGGLPYEAGRKSIQGHIVQLRNLDTANLDNNEKMLIAIRKKLMGAVKTIYIELQKKALGLENEETSQAIEEQEELNCASVRRIDVFSEDDYIEEQINLSTETAELVRATALASVNALESKRSQNILDAAVSGFMRTASAAIVEPMQAAHDEERVDDLNRMLKLFDEDPVKHVKDILWNAGVRDVNFIEEENDSVGAVLLPEEFAGVFKTIAGMVEERIKDFPRSYSNDFGCDM